MLLTALIALAAVRSASPSFAVNVTGHGPPVLLVPGLSCGADVWDGVVAHLSEHYACHALTLPGFAGQPAIPMPILATVRDQIEAYIGSQGLNRPILVGHSLGGSMALWLAAHRPDLFGAVVTIDGVPALGYLANPAATAGAVHDAAEAVRKRYASMDQVQFERANATAVGAMISLPGEVPPVLAGMNRSDHTAVGRALAELLELDVRPELEHIRCPVIAIVPANQAETPAVVDAIKSKYEAQFHSIPEHAIVVVPHARHFVMLDAPAETFRIIDEFLAHVVRRS